MTALPYLVKAFGVRKALAEMAAAFSELEEARRHVPDTAALAHQ